jgi:hypothetical protein
MERSPGPGPEPQSKSNDLLQAQLASFAAERLPHRDDEKHVLNNVVTLAAGEPGDVTRVLEAKEYVRDDTGGVTGIAEGTERLVATQQDYQDYLAEVGGSRHESIAKRAELLAAYSEYDQYVAQLRQDMARYPSRKEHPNFLGSGANADAFLLPVADQELVVRIPHEGQSGAAGIDHHLRGGLRAMGQPHLEQLVAVSYESGVTISNLMPGSEMSRIKAEDLRQVTDAQLSELIDTVTVANQAGVTIDPKPSNFFYDKDQGFGIIDVGSSEEKTAAEQSVMKVVGWIPGDVINNAGSYGFRPMTKEDYQYLHEQSSAGSEVLGRFKEICSQRFSGEEGAYVMQAVDAGIEASQRAIAQYSSDEWVDAKIEADRLRREDFAKAVAERAARRAAGVDLDGAASHKLDVL